MRKVANYIGSKAYDLEKLRLGEFFYNKGSETKWITTQEFKPITKPRKIELPQKPILQHPIKKKTQDQDSTKAVASLIIALMWFAAIMLALSQRI